MVDLIQVLTTCVKLSASDVMIAAGNPPMTRIRGIVSPVPGFESARLTHEEAKELIYKTFTPNTKVRFEANWEADYSFSIPNVCRFRVNAFIQRQGISSVFRVIPSRIPTPEELNLTKEMITLSDLPRGLVLVTGPTGSGKSTTLACLMELVNQKHRKTIITIEDPIEFVYENKASLIMQREVGQHTKSFQSALRSALRQAPDVILVGEMRDTETISLAITAAETGHLCFGTLHTQSCAATIDRIIDVFPSEQQPQIRSQLALTLRAVVSQILLPKKDSNERVAAREFMMMTNAISSLIREGKAHMIDSAIETGKGLGMFTMDQQLAVLLGQGMISADEAMRKAHSPQNVLNLSKLNAKPLNATITITQPTK